MKAKNQLVADQDATDQAATDQAAKAAERAAEQKAQAEAAHDAAGSIILAMAESGTNATKKALSFLKAAANRVKGKLPDGGSMGGRITRLLTLVAPYVPDADTTLVSTMATLTACAVSGGHSIPSRNGGTGGHTAEVALIALGVRETAGDFWQRMASNL